MNLVNAVAAPLLVVMLAACVVQAQVYTASGWGQAKATFYEGMDTGGTTGGACGYGNLYNTGYGKSTATLRAPLFNGGKACGACFQLTCIPSKTKYCYGGGKSIAVTATNFCPKGSEGGWCNPPNKHFDLSYPMFTVLAKKEGGVILVNLRRVACSKKGGMKFTINGNPYFFLVLVYNVAGAGDVQRLFIKSPRTNWVEMKRNWGQMWTYNGGPKGMVGQAISFRAHTSDGRQVVSTNTARANWRFGQTFQGSNLSFSTSPSATNSRAMELDCSSSNRRSKKNNLGAPTQSRGIRYPKNRVGGSHFCQEEFKVAEVHVHPLL